MSDKPRTEYRVERWWGNWCVADSSNKSGVPVPVYVSRWRWKCWREANRLAAKNYGDAVMRNQYYTLSDQGYG